MNDSEDALDYRTANYDYKFAGQGPSGPLYTATPRRKVEDDDWIPWLVAAVYGVPAVVIILMKMF